MDNIKNQKLTAQNQGVIPEPDISVEQASIVDLSKEVIALKQELKDQRAMNWNIVIGVAIAFLFAVGLVAVEVILFHSNADKNLLDIQNRYFQEIKDLRENNFQNELKFQKEIDSLKERLVSPTPSAK